MPSGVWTWSQTAATNAAADSNIGWSEGQAPSSINDSARAMMAVLKKHDDDISGAITTGGSSTAFTVTSYSSFDSLAHMSGQLLAFTPHATSGAAPTLNVDGLGAKPLRGAPSIDLPAGVLIQGTPYLALYNNSDAVWYLRGGAANANAYSVPLGGGLFYWGSTAPNSAFAFPYGQAISRSTYSALFSLISTTYGSGDGSTTFNLPDCRGRFIAAKDNMGGTGAGRMQSGNGGVDGTTLGASGGADTKTLTASQIPTITSTVSTSGSLSGSTSSVAVGNSASSTGGGGFPIAGSISYGAASVSVSGSMTGSATSNNTSGAAHSIMPPCIVANYILRVA